MAYLTLFVPASSNNKNESNVASPIKPQQRKIAMRKDVGTNTNTLAADVVERPLMERRIF